MERHLPLRKVFDIRCACGASLCYISYFFCLEEKKSCAFYGGVSMESKIFFWREKSVDFDGFSPLGGSGCFDFMLDPCKKCRNFFLHQQSLLGKK